MDERGEDKERHPRAGCDAEDADAFGQCERARGGVGDDREVVISSVERETRDARGRTGRTGGEEGEKGVVRGDDRDDDR